MDPSRHAKRRKLKLQRPVIKEYRLTSGGGRQFVGQQPVVRNHDTNAPTCSTSVAAHKPTALENPLYQDENVPEMEQRSQHEKRKEETSSKWTSIMEDLHNAHFAQQAPPVDTFCRSCDILLEEGIRIVKCDDCICTMCTECAEKHHVTLPFHNLYVWNEMEFYVPLEYKRVVKAFPHTCNSYTLQHKIEIIDERGQSFQCTIECCSCGKLPTELVKLGFWPSSPAKPTRAYHQGFLLTLVYLMLEGHMSLLASCKSLMWKNKWTTKMADSIYRQLTTEECFEEFRHFHHQTRTLQGVCAEDQCPACPRNLGTTFVSLDANFGLVRKQNAGKSVQGAKHGNKMFLDDEEVREFVGNYKTDAGKSSSSSDCNQFQAGDSVRSKNKAVRLDKTGVFGSACRHGFPCKFLNMEHGERYAYPMMIIKKLIEEKKGTNVVVSYDIACKLKLHIQKTNQEEILQQINLVLPCWHAYGHSAACQTMYSTRCVEGCGLCDGEEMERLWSYLRPFSHISKEMTPSHRIDLLCDALLHYGRKKSQDIVESIKHRAEKAQLMHRQAVDKLHLILDGNHTVNEVSLWKEEEKAQLQRTKQRSKLQWQEDYVCKLQTYHLTRVHLAVAEDEVRALIINQHCENLEKELKSIEKKNIVTRRWEESDQCYKDALERLELVQKSSLIKKLRHDVAEYLFMLETQKKYSDGQAIAIRIKKQVEKTSRCVNNTISRYNDNNFKTDFQLPRNILRKDALNTQHIMYHTIEEDVSNISQSLKRQAIELYNLMQRTEEEVDLIMMEKKDVVSYYEKCYEKLQVAMSELETENNRYARGCRSVMLQKMKYFEDVIHDAEQAFQS